MAKILSLWGTYFTTGFKKIRLICLFICLIITCVYVGLHMCAHVCRCWVHTCHSTHVGIRGQLSRARSLIPHVGFQGLNSGGSGLPAGTFTIFQDLRDLVSPYFVFETGNFEARNAGLEVTRQLRMTLNALLASAS